MRLRNCQKQEKLNVISYEVCLLWMCMIKWECSMKRPLMVLIWLLVVRSIILIHTVFNFCSEALNQNQRCKERGEVEDRRCCPHSSRTGHLFILNLVTFADILPSIQSFPQGHTTSSREGWEDSNKALCDCHGAANNKTGTVFNMEKLRNNHRTQFVIGFSIMNLSYSLQEDTAVQGWITNLLKGMR